MYLLSKPTIHKIQSFINTQRERPWSYKEVEATNNKLPSDYIIDHNRIYLGSGLKTFEKAKTAIRQWEMFNIAWVWLCWPEAPIAVGSTVAILVRVFGIWSLNAARIVYLIDEAGDIERFGFAYGTLPDHAERGEERFCVEWHHEDDSVWYDLLAFSKPNQLLARIAYPYTRILQKRFAADSKKAMVKAVNRL